MSLLMVFLRYNALSIQIVKRKITLSTLCMNDEKKFVFEERRSATVPISYQERFNWLQIFEMLADFEVCKCNSDVYVFVHSG